MLQKRYEINSLVGQEIRLGCVGENNVRCVELDVTAWLQNNEACFFIVFVVPPASGCASSVSQGYLAKTTYADGVISWVITSNDTKSEGSGSIEVIMYGTDNAILQSTTIDIRVLPSMSHTAGGCGCGANPNQPWVDQVARMAMDAQDAAKRAEAALESVEQLAVTSALPPGGEANQVLAKLSDADGDVGWVDAPASEREVVNKPTHYDFPSVGSTEVIYKAEEERKLYQWNPDELRYDLLSEADTIDTDTIDIIYGGDAYGTD